MKYFDVLVQWDIDGSSNIVSTRELRKMRGCKSFKVGAMVEMWWEPEKKYYTGRITGKLCSVNKSPQSSVSLSDSDDDIPLAKLRKQTDHDYKKVCCQTGCGDEIFAACPICLSLLCFDHFDNLTTCDLHPELPQHVLDELLDNMDDPFHGQNEGQLGIMIDDNDYRMDTDFEGHRQTPSQSPSPSIMSPIVSPPPSTPVLHSSALELSSPESFHVDGTPKIPSCKTPSPKKRKRDERKKLRNLGLSYVTESGKTQPARRVLLDRCNTAACRYRKLECDNVTEDERVKLLNAYYDMGDLHEQRAWIIRHISVATPERRDGDQSTIKRPKLKTINYTLPVQGENKPVCRTMFLNSLGISYRQVRTALEKVGTDGVMEKDNRGGRHDNVKEIDAKLRQYVKDHINRFPRMESHFCRSSTGFQYLSPELSITKMYNMYVQEQNPRVSFEFYRKVFKQMKIKFHIPKKDQCGLCSTFYDKNSNNAELESRFTAHIAEKLKVRELKEFCKIRAISDNNRKFVAAVFDLESVLYLPLSKRGEIFYKRRLSCYNFTIYELASKQGHCYFWHEAIASRGANEISSCLFHFLSTLDKEGVNEIALFADGCYGQNKNSIVVVMLKAFLEISQSVKSIVLHFFETNHGQSEGDSMHSLVERAVGRAGEIIIPAQLETVIQMAAVRKPFILNSLKTQDIKDWKEVAKNVGILRIRSSDGGKPVKWTDFMQVKISKDDPDRIMYKSSHLSDDFDILTLPPRRNKVTYCPLQAYKTPPKLSEAKYNDLLSLCTGLSPVVVKELDQNFYKSLPH